MSITFVADKALFQKLIGDGYAIKPTNNKIYTLGTNTIVSIFPTKHAFSSKDANDTEVLLHLGIDAIELNGAPFCTAFKAREKVEAGTLQETMDRKKTIAAGKEVSLIVVFTNLQDNRITLVSKVLLSMDRLWGKFWVNRSVQMHKIVMWQSVG